MSNKKLNAVITIGGAISGTFNTVVRSTTSQLKRIGSEVNRLKTSQRQLGDSIQTFGRMGKNVDNLRSRYSVLTGQLNKARQEQERLTKAAERHASLTRLGSKSMMLGAAVGASGTGILATMHSPMEKAKYYQTEVARIQSLGLDNAAIARTEKYAKDFKSFGNSQLDKLELMRDSLSIFGGDEHHAQMAMPTLTKMRFANSVLFGKEAGAEKTKQLQDMLKVIELRGGAKDQASFDREANWIQKVISSTGGRVQGDEWRKVIATGGIAAKSMKSDVFYKLLEPLVQEMGGDRAGTGLMSAYSSLYQGRTTKRASNNLDRLGLIGDHSKVKHDKSGQVSFMDPGALLGADVFRRNQLEWMENVFLPQLAKNGITSEDKILDTIGSVVSNRKGADYLSTLFLQRQQIHKSMSLTDKSADINTVEKNAKDTAAGKEEDLRARKDKAMLALGKQVLPLYVKGLEFAANALEKLNGFIERNPTLTKVMAVGFTVVGAALAVIAPLLIGGGGLIWGLGQFVSVGVKVSPLLGKLGTGFKLLKSPIFGSGAGVMAFKNKIVSATSSIYKFVTSGNMLRTVFGKIGSIAFRSFNLAKNSVVGALAVFGRFKNIVSGAARSIVRFATSGNVIRSTFRIALNVVKQVGLAMLRTPWGAVAALAIGAGLAIYKYWDQIKAFFSGFWEGLKKGIEPFTTAVSELVKSTPLLGEAWDLVSGAVKKAWDWFTQLLTPVKASKEQIDGAKDAGVKFGELVGNALSLVLTPLTAIVDLFKWIFNFGGKVFDWIGKIGSANVAPKITPTVTIPQQVQAKPPMQVPMQVPKLQMPKLGNSLGESFFKKQNDQSIILNQFNRTESSSNFRTINNSLETTQQPPILPEAVQRYLPQDKQDKQDKPINKAAQQAQAQSITQHFSFSIAAAPNQSPQQIADEVIRKLKRQQGVQQRSSMVDQGFSQ